MPGTGRNTYFGHALLFLRWAAEREEEFNVHHVVDMMEVHTRTAYRYLEAAEAAGAIVVINPETSLYRRGTSGAERRRYRSTIALRRAS